VLRITYQLTCAPGEHPRDKAQDIALEQTAELPLDTVAGDVAARLIGAVETVEPLEGGRWGTVIAYDDEAAGADVLQLVNLMFGGISMKSGILITDLELSPALLAALPGPAFGIQGLRALCGVARRPLLCTAIKPMGLSAARLADLAYHFARGGLDVVKDDHGVTSQPSAPFPERVARCQEAVARANAETGGQALYFPNVTGTAPQLAERLETARAAGCRGVLVSPLLQGLDAVRAMAGASGLAILSHPTLAGVFFHPDHGISPGVLFGKLYRLIGADGVIYPNPGGRFQLAEAAARAINANLRAEWGALRPALPVPGGGMDAARVPHWAEQYGPDTMFLVGSSLYAQGDVESAARRLRETVERLIWRPAPAPPSPRPAA
jgi:ribulose-bisphosphate carboxylase large chain